MREIDHPNFYHDIKKGQKAHNLFPYSFKQIKLILSIFLKKYGKENILFSRESNSLQKDITTIVTDHCVDLKKFNSL